MDLQVPSSPTPQGTCYSSDCCQVHHRGVDNNYMWTKQILSIELDLLQMLVTIR